MIFTVATAIIFGLLFLLAFVTKRRFGVLALSLVAGEMLSRLWMGELTPMVAEAGIITVKPPLSTIVAAMLILAPAILLLFSGPTAHNKNIRIGGSIIFAILGVMLLFDPMRSAFIIEGVGSDLQRYILMYQAVIVTVCILLALVDVFITRTPKHASHRKK